MLAAVLLLPGLARGQTITATSAQDYVTAITEANGPPPAGVTVINSPAGTVISLGSVTLPAIGTNAVLQIGSNTVDSPISGGTIVNNGSLVFTPPTGASDTISTTITGSGQVSQGWLGTLTFTDNGTNTYSGGTGTAANVVLGDGTTNIGTLGSGPVFGEGTLIFNEPRAITFATSITDDVNVTQNGPGTVTFTDNGSNSYSGQTTINAGTLVLGDGTTNTGTLGNSDLVNVNSALTFNEPSAVTISNQIQGYGTVTQNGPGTVTFTDNGNNNFGGNVYINGGTLALGDGTTNTGTLGESEVNDSGALVFNEPSAVTTNAEIQGPGTVTIEGPGPVTFTESNQNNYSGATTITAGSTLILGDGNSYNGTLGSSNVTNNGSLVFNEARAITIGNNIGGTGTVTQQDTPGVTLSGTNTYSGATTVIGNNNLNNGFVYGYYPQQQNYGVLQLQTESALSPNTTITLQQAGGLVANYALDQTTLNAISSNSVGFVALGANSANNLDFTNLPQVSLGADGLDTNQTYTGTLTPTPPGSASLSLTNYQYQVGGGNGFLTLNTNLTDFSNGEVTTPAELDAVNNGFTILQGFNTFSGGMNVSLGVVELTSSISYCGLDGDCQARQTTPPIQVAQTGVLATSYALDQRTLNVIAPTSAGTVALGADSSNNLDFTGLPNVSLGAVGGYTYSGTITPGSNGYLLGGGGDFRVNSVLTVTQPLTGANTLTVNQPEFDLGTVVLVNAETYTGNTTIDGGILQLGNGSSNGTIANTPLVTINNTSSGYGYLAFNEATPITFANPITGGGSVQQFGPGTVTLTQSETYTGSTSIYGGTLALAAGSSIEPSVYVVITSNNAGSPTALDISQGGNQTVQNLQSTWAGGGGPVTAQVLLGGNTLTDIANSGSTAIDAVISGTGSFVKQGSQQLTLSNINTYSGGTTISAGTLVLGGQAYGAPAWTIGTAGSGPITDNAALVFYEPSAVTLPNAIGGTGTVTQSGPGTVTLSGTNTYSGGTSIGGSFTLALGGQATGAPSATVGTLGTGAVANSGTLLFTEPSAVTLPNLISGTGTVTQDGPGTVTLTAVNTYSGGTTITAGTLALGGTTVGGLGSGAVTDNGTLQFTEPSAVTFSNVISGSGAVTQTGPGTVALSATNTYTGGTTIGSGAALMLGASTVGTAGTGSVTDNGTLVFSEPSAVTIGNAIGGSGGIEQAGPGEVTLTNSNSYTGGTLVYSGTLALGSGGSIAGSSAVTIASVNGSGGFGVLDISAAGNQTLNNLSSAWYLSSGTAGASVVLGSNTLTVNTTAATAFDGVISGTGGLIKSNTATLALAGPNTYSGGTTISAGTLQLGGQAAGAPAATIGTLGSGAVTDNANLAFAEPSAVTFGNAISGTGSVMQVGPGTVTLSSTNTYSGGTGIASGSTLGLGGQATGAPSATIGTLGTGAVTDNGTLLLTEPGAVTLANLIGGTGTVTQDGPGIVTLSALNSYSGGTTITGGTLALGNPAGTIGGVGSGAVTDNGTLQFSEPSAVSFGNVISGSGGVLQSGPGAVMLTATNTYSGGTTIVGTLALGDGTTHVGTPGSGAVTVESTGLLEFNEPTAVTIGNAIGGPGMVIQYGPGTVTLTQQETYTGSTVIYNGTLALGSGASIANSGGVTIASTYGSSGFGVLDISQAGNQTVQNLFSQYFGSGTPGASIVLGGNTLTETNTLPSSFDGVISGTGAFVKQGSQMLILAGSNTYSGGTTISAGTLVLGGQATGAPAATVGTLGSGPVTDNAALVFNEPSAVTFGNVVGGSGTVTQDGPGAVTLDAANTYTGGTTIGSGTTLALGGAAVGSPGSGAITDSGTLAFIEPSAVTIINVISGTGGVTQSGPGAITLNSASTYSGLTEVKSGTLIVGSAANNGASVGGSVLVDTGATLAGYGTLGVTVVDPPMLVNNGTVIPGGVSGNAPGILTVNGNYAQGSGGNLLIAVTPSQASELNVHGTASLAGTITFAYAPGTYVPTTYTVVATTGAISGTFGTVAEQGAIPTSLTRKVEYVASTPDPVLLVLSASAVVTPASDSIFSEQLSSLTALADSATTTLLDGGTGANDCPMGGVPPTPSESGPASLASADIAALARVICGKGGWIHADGTFLGVNGSDGFPNYHANTAGFLAGIDRPVGEGGLRLGIAAGYDHRWLTDSAGASAAADVARFGLYAIQPVGPIVLNAAFLYGRDWDTTNRPTGIGIANAQYGGNEFSGGVRASLPLTLGGFTAVPMGGVRFASVNGGAFTESGAGAASGFGVSGASTTQLSVVPFARIVVSRDFALASGVTLSPYAALGYQYQAGTTEQPVLLTASDGTTFNAGSASLDRSAATLGVGVAAGQGNWSVFAAYGALVSGNWQEQEVNVGVRVDF